jgi:hypothetical protein
MRQEIDCFCLSETSPQVQHQMGNSHSPHHTTDANVHILW